MKKTDLYYSIDSIKPDKDLKGIILKAVEENDKVTVIRKPLFIPVMVALLLCINVGMAAKMLVANREQYISDLNERTSMSRADANGNKSNNINNDLESADRGKAELKKRDDFQNYVNEFQAELDSRNLMQVEDWYAGTTYIPEQDNPYYYMNNAELRIDFSYQGDLNIESYHFVRYVECIVAVEKKNADYDGAEQEISEVYSIYTNHEYIVAYDGDILPENIVSITESNAEPYELTEHQILEDFKAFDNNDKVVETMERVGNELLNEYDTDFDVRTFGWADNYYIYPTAGSGESGEMIQRRYISLGNRHVPDSWDWEAESDILGYYFIDKNGNDVSDKIAERTYGESEKYWKETVCLYEDSTRKKVAVPDIIGMTPAEAEEALEAVGLKLGQRSYFAPESNEFEFNQIMSCSEAAASVVYQDTPIDISICAQAVPRIQGLSLQDAMELLADFGFTIKVEYLDGVDPNDADLYVYASSPNSGATVKEIGEVTIMAASPETDTAAELIGSVVSMRRQYIYYGDEAEEVIAGKKPSEESTILFDDYPAYAGSFSGITANGRYYGSNNEYFKIESIITGSTSVWTLPYLKCGMTCASGVADCLVNGNVLEGGTLYDLGSSNLENFNYYFHYKKTNGKELYVYIKTEDLGEQGERISLMCVSDKSLA